MILITNCNKLEELIVFVVLLSYVLLIFIEEYEKNIEDMLWLCKSVVKLPLGGLRLDCLVKAALRIA